MKDLYFNEMSINFEFSESPTSVEEAQEMLLTFIKCCFSYILCHGIGSDIALSYHGQPFSQNILFGHHNIGSIIRLLQEQNLLTEEEAYRFRSFIGESFEEEIEPEYRFQDNIIYGLGEAHKKGSYAISFFTHEEWENPSITLEQITTTEADLILSPVEAPHISKVSHIVNDHEIWQGCVFVNSRPQNEKLPNKHLTETLLSAFDIESWNTFYENVQNQEVTKIRRLGTLIAKINGWSELGVQAGRLTFQARNYYLAIDTQHATYEVYEGKNTHLGEMKFNNETLEKQDDRRALNF